MFANIYSSPPMELSVDDDDDDDGTGWIESKTGNIIVHYCSCSLLERLMIKQAEHN